MRHRLLLRPALVALAAAVSLSACSSPAPLPAPSAVPSVTVRTVHVSALSGDREAALLARVSVQALVADGFDARLARPQGLAPAAALTALQDHTADVVLGGTASWSGAIAGATRAAAPSQGASSAARREAAPPMEAQAALDAVNAHLPQELAVGVVAASSRTDVLAVTAARAGFEDLATAASVKAGCSSAVLAVTEQWWDAWGSAWSRQDGCAPRRVSQGVDDDAVLRELVSDRAQAAIVHADDPRVAGAGLITLAPVAADPIAGLITADHVGQDALDSLARVAAAAQGEAWARLLRLDAGDGGADDTDVRLWLRGQGLMKDGADDPGV